MKQSYGFCYDKHGTLKEVQHPVKANGKLVKPHKKTKIGKIPSGVGFSKFTK